MTILHDFFATQSFQFPIVLPAADYPVFSISLAHGSFFSPSCPYAKGELHSWLATQPEHHALHAALAHAVRERDLPTVAVLRELGNPLLDYSLPLCLAAHSGQVDGVRLLAPLSDPAGLACAMLCAIDQHQWACLDSLREAGGCWEQAWQHGLRTQAWKPMHYLMDKVPITTWATTLDTFDLQTQGYHVEGRHFLRHLQEAWMRLMMEGHPATQPVRAAPARL